jgi:hypothetical protein
LSDFDKQKQLPELVVDVDFEEELRFHLESTSVDKVSSIIGQALEQIEELSDDTKSDALLQLIVQIAEKKIAAQRICILTEYFATLWYLSAYFEGEIDNVLLYGEMSPEHFARSIAAFAGGEGVLVATREAAGLVVDLSETTDLVLYDSPYSEEIYREIMLRFAPIDRRSQLDVHILSSIRS